MKHAEPSSQPEQRSVSASTAMQDSPAAGETSRRDSLDSPQAGHVKSAYPRRDAVQIRRACRELDTFELFKG